MSRNAPIPRVYVVAWASEGVFKIGYTERTRWRKFLATGAEMVALYTFDSHSDAFHVESWLQSAADELGPRAFPAVNDLARNLLRDKGGGYRECYIGSPDHARAVISRAMQLAMPNAYAGGAS